MHLVDRYNIPFDYHIDELDLDVLDHELMKNGWRPPLDMIDRIGSAGNRFCQRLSEEEMKKYKYIEGLVTFIVRERGLELLNTCEVLDILSTHGFEILFSDHLTDDQIVTCTNSLRGGNWGTGPYARSGGVPVYFVVGIDTRGGLTKQVKETIRAKANERVSKTDRCNVLHTSDHPRQSLYYIDVISPKLRIMLEDARTLDNSMNRKTST